MIGSQRILGADVYATNIAAVGNNYLPQVQASTGQRSKLHKVVVSNITAGTPFYLWLFDLAAGVQNTSVGPREVCLCPAGVCTTLDFSTGMPYVNGIYAQLNTGLPPDAGTAGVSVGNNAGILDIAYRLE